MSAQPDVGPAPSSALMTPAEIAREFRRSVGRVRRYLAAGTLHGHRITESRGGRWDVPRAVALAWLSGRDEAAQRAVCPLCPAPDPSPLRRRAGRRRP